MTLLTTEEYARTDPAALMYPRAAWRPWWYTDRQSTGTDGIEVADFSEHFLRVSKGFRAGDPLRMTDWQAWLLAWLLERRADNGRLRYRQAVIGEPRKMGKATAVTTPLLTGNRGWITMGEVQVGDTVHAGDGTLTRVEAVSEVMLGHDCYRVTLSDGESLVVDAGHLWEVHDRMREKVRVIDTETMADTYRVGNRESHKEHRYRIPSPVPLHRPEVDLPLDPYLLGYWLGDGGRGTAQVTVGNHDLDPFLACLDALGIEYTATDKAPTLAHSVSLRGVKRSLQEAGVLDRKHVPDVYATASYAQRLALVQGLMDSDGHIEPVSGRGLCELSFCDEELSDGAALVLRSLGIKVTRRVDDAKLYGRVTSQRYRLNFHPNGVPVFRLPRKSRHVRLSNGRGTSRTVVNVESVLTVPVRCIRVAHSGHLFHAGRGLIPTHNSLSAAAMALYYLVGSPDLGRELYSIAGDAKQARMVFGEARQQVLGSALLSKELKVFRDVIEHPKTGSLYRVLSHDGKLAQGLNPYMVFADEPLSLETLIPTPTGWTTMGDLSVGDLVLGSDGLPCRVMAKTPVLLGRDCVRVTFRDGTSVVTDAAHLWRVEGYSGRTDVPGGHTQRSDHLVRHAGGRTYRAILPQSSPMLLPEADLPIGPYLLGLWLGDGDVQGGSIIGLPEDLEVYREYVGGTIVPVSGRRAARLSFSRVQDGVCVRGHEVVRWYTKTRRNGVVQRECPTCVKERRDGVRSPSVAAFTTLLRQEGLWRHKHIPDAYLRASWGQRLALLQGLMDTDGWVSEDGTEACLSTADAALAGQVAELLRTLGYSPHVRRNGSCWQVAFQPSAAAMPFRLSRKAERVGRETIPPPRVATVEPVESVPVQCVSVDSADHLFRVGEGMHLTHNCHVYPNEELWDAMTQGSGARPESLVVAITTAGHHTDSLLGRLFDYGRKVVDGEIEDDAFGFAWWQAPDGCDHRDEEVWHKANPNLALGLADLDEMRTALRQSPEATFRRYRLNQWVPLAGRGWMDMAAWKRQQAPVRDIAPKTDIVMAFDGSVTEDATALVGMTMDGYLFVIGCWENDGTEDWQVPRDEVEDAIAAAWEKWNVRIFQVDHAYWLSEAKRWEEKWGKRKVIVFGNSNARMVPAVQAFYAGIVDREITHSGDPRLTRHMGNAVEKELPTGSTIRKPGDSRSPHKIDLAVASCIANDARVRLRQNKPGVAGF